MTVVVFVSSSINRPSTYWLEVYCNLFIHYDAELLRRCCCILR